MSITTDYLRKIEQALKVGNATEHTHRPALKSFVEAIRPGITATNEPQRTKCGAPDFIVNQQAIPLGYIEAKDVGVDLDRAEESEQLKRYRDSLRNLILTDYLEFRLYRNGEKVQTVRVGRWLKSGSLRRDPDELAKLEILLNGFLDADVPTVGTSKELAERMARIARLLHDLIRGVFAQEGQTGDLHSQYDAFKKILISDLSVDQFSDMYAQTIAYGLFAARCNHNGQDFTREHAGRQLPKTNPFLRKLFNSIAGADLDERISWAVDDLTQLLAKADMSAVLKNFGNTTRQEDPVVHFYETFLVAYDPKLRELRGVYYTPEPVVSYIVRSVDALLKRDFKLPDGLANSSRLKLKRPKTKGKADEVYETHKVQILDPACGTGTFLHSVVAAIQDRFAGNAGLWPAYVGEHLLPRVYGFELLMAPYAVAHMKLGLQLKDSGYDFRTDERLRVFLTNTLEEAHEMTGLPLFTQWLAEEAAAASEVKKDVPIMVVLGNPPYSGHSPNKGGWITSLLDDYKKSPELKKPAQAKWLSDDYVKFIRFAQWRIEETGYGVLGFITNHRYLENTTFLDMRQSLMKTFDDIYVLDLHGNSKNKERSPTGEKDENVFDIQQGVAIALMVRRNTRSAKCTVRRADLWGSREPKYAWLDEADVTNTAWREITPKAAPWFFIEQDTDRLAEYDKGWSVSRIFSPAGDPAPGVVTTHDDFAISWTPEEAITKVEKLLATNSESEAREIFRLCSQNQWNYDKAKRELADGAWRRQLTPILYRPFDVRWTIWNPNVAVHRRERVFEHLRNRKNLALLVSRVVETGSWCHVFVGDGVMGHHCVSLKEVNYALPLWLYSGEGDLLGDGDGRRTNIDKDFQSALKEVLHVKIVAPDDVFAYIYATLYSTKYREEYSEFLRRGYPHVPLPVSTTHFQELVTIGNELIALHLLKTVPRGTTKYPIAGNNHIDRVSFAESEVGFGRIYINQDQFFEGVPEPVWKYVIGGYQIAQRWLSDRKGRLLTYDELAKYQSILSALAQTIQVQSKIDSVREQ